MNSKEKYRELIVMGTVSSGKSTFINALLGEPILPAKNQVCTGHNLGIVFDKFTDSAVLNVRDRDSEYKFKDAIQERIDEYNKRDDCIDMEISYPSKKEWNNIPVKITDTPGGNACEHQIHREIAKNALQDNEYEILIYIMNAEVLFTDEDRQYLNEIIKKSNNQKIIFVINKIDEIDSDKESLQEIIVKSENYLKQFEIRQPAIYPCAGKAALILKKVLSGKQLTKDEMRRLSGIYEMFGDGDLKLSSKHKIPVRLWLKNSIKINGGSYKPRRLYKALINTGIIEIEKNICNLLEQI